MLNSIFGYILEKLPENNKLERIWVLAKVDFNSRYYYHKLGVIWALIRPMVELVVYFTIFKTIFNVGVPNFELYIFSGLLVWYFFTEGTSKGYTVLLTKRYLIESIQFNKTDLFVSATLSALLAFLFNFSAYLIISLIIDHPPFYSSFIFFPILIVITSLMILGLSLILATLSIYFKDIQHLWDMAILTGFWATPIVYDETVLLEKLPYLVYLNPVAGIIVNVHKVLLYGEYPDFNLLLYNFVLAVIILFFGLFFFNKYSHKAAEKI